MNPKRSSVPNQPDRRPAPGAPAIGPLRAAGYGGHTSQPTARFVLLGAVLCAGLAVLFGTSLVQSRFAAAPGVPPRAKPVPMPLLAKIAKHKCQARWGAGALGDPIPLSDLDGNVTAYAFPFRIGASMFPAAGEILARVKEGRQLREHLENGRLEQARDLYRLLESRHDSTVSQAPRPIRRLPEDHVAEIGSVRPDGSMPRSLQVAEMRAMERFARARASGADQFGTIIVSARYDRVPVPAYFNYLFQSLTHGDLAVKKAEDVVGHGASLRRTYFLGLKGRFFEMEGPGGRVVLHGSTLAVQGDDTLAKLKNTNLTPEAAARRATDENRRKLNAKLRAEWDALAAELGEK